jgi:DNA-directed RNA polymerase
MPTLEEQLDLEKEMLNDGINRYQSNTNKLIQKGLESNTQHGRAMITAIVNAVADGVTDIQTEVTSNRDIARKNLQGMDAHQVAYLSLITVVDEVSKRFTLMKVAKSLGANIELQKRLSIWVEAEGKPALNVIRKANEKSSKLHKRQGLVYKMNKDGYAHTEWTNEERIHTGMRLIDKIVIKTGLVRLTKSIKKNKTITYLQATPETLAWVQKFNTHQEVMKPRFAPSLIPPKDWDGVMGGGYHSEVINQLPLVRVH